MNMHMEIFQAAAAPDRVLVGSCARFSFFDLFVSDFFCDSKASAQVRNSMDFEACHQQSLIAKTGDCPRPATTKQLVWHRLRKCNRERDSRKGHVISGIDLDGFLDAAFKADLRSKGSKISELAP